MDTKKNAPRGFDQEFETGVTLNVIIIVKNVARCIGAGVKTHGQDNHLSEENDYLSQTISPAFLYLSAVFLTVRLIQT